MRQTYVKAVLDLTDLSALSDASESVSSKKSYSDLHLLKDEIRLSDYATDELNSFVLDDSKAVMDRMDDIAWVSLNKSGNDCIFAQNTGIDITFIHNHTSIGLTLCFGTTIPEEIFVTWYNDKGVEITSAIAYPDEQLFFIDQLVEGYRRIKVVYVRSKHPYEYATLQFMRYGRKQEWSKSEIKNAKVLEQIDMTSATLSINTASISIVDEKGAFDIKNENGAWKSIQKTQKLVLTEFNGQKEVDAGTYYIKEQSYAGNIASFSCIDAIGLMDNYIFYEGTIYNGTLAKIIIDKIMETCGITDYFVAEEIGDIPLYGWLGIQTCREALQMVCFATGSIADDSRSSTIRIYKPDRYVSSEVGVERKFDGGTTVGRDEYVSGVLIEYPRYSLSNKQTKIYDDDLEAGDTRITFKSPYDPNSITVSGGTKIKATTNYIDVRMTENTKCTINGTKYEAEEFSFQKTLENIDVGEAENIKELSGCTLYNGAILPTIAKDLLNYYALRKTVSMRFIMNDERSGAWINIRDINKNRATSVVESMDIDLANGYIASASCRGYAKVTTDYVYTGEIFAGETWVE